MHFGALGFISWCSPLTPFLQSALRYASARGTTAAALTHLLSTQYTHHSPVTSRYSLLATRQSPPLLRRRRLYFVVTVSCDLVIVNWIVNCDLIILLVTMENRNANHLAVAVHFWIHFHSRSLSNLVYQIYCLACFSSESETNCCLVSCSSSWSAKVLCYFRFKKLSLPF